MRIDIETEFGPKVLSLLNAHLQSMAAESPPESMHALDVSGLKKADVTFWCVWDSENQLMGCGAIKQLDSVRAGGHAEIKSMKTADQHLRKGVAAALLERIIETARERGYQRLSLETGSMAAFAPAHKLYKRYGFVECEPFADYMLDPHSIFMTLELNLC